MLPQGQSGMGMPPSPSMGGSPGGENAMEANRSVMNPIDMAAMQQNGTVNQNMTVKDLIEKVFKVPMDAPVSALTEAIKKQGLNQNGVGKMQAMGGKPVGSAMGPRNATGPGRPMPNRPQPAPQRMPQPSAAPTQGISDMMGR